MASRQETDWLTRLTVQAHSWQHCWVVTLCFVKCCDTNSEWRREYLLFQITLTIKTLCQLFYIKKRFKNFKNHVIYSWIFLMNGNQNKMTNKISSFTLFSRRNAHLQEVNSAEAASQIWASCQKVVGHCNITLKSWNTLLFVSNKHSPGCCMRRSWRFFFFFFPPPGCRDVNLLP